MNRTARAILFVFCTLLVWMIGWPSILWVLGHTMNLLGSLTDLYRFWNVLGREGLVSPLLDLGIAFLTISMSYHSIKTELPYLLEKKALPHVGVILILFFIFLGILH